MSADLLFGPKATSGLPVELVFGADDAPVAENRTVSVSGVLPGLRGLASVRAARAAGIVGAFPALSGRAAVRYDSSTERPIVCDLAANFQGAVPQSTANRAKFRQSLQHTSGTVSRFSDAWTCSARASVRWQEAQRFRGLRTSVFQDAKRVGVTPARTHYQDCTRLRGGARSVFEEAVRVPFPIARSHYQEAFRDRRNFTAARFQTGHAYSVALRENEDVASPLLAGLGARYQEARRPLIGIWVPGVTPVTPPCYMPAVPADLVFGNQWSDDTNLIFVCDGASPPDPGKTVVVPVRRFYLVINDVSLLRVADNFRLSASALSISADVDSFQIGFEATLSAKNFDDVMPAPDPVELEARVNGTTFRLVVDTVSRERTFAKGSVSISGRGWAAALADPFAAAKTWSNPEALTAQQLAAAALPDGWTLDWQIDDWFVGAGAWSFTGTPAAAVARIAEAAGAYVVPGRATKTLSIIHRYPKAPWEWESQTPDIILPSAAVTKEALDVRSKADYNAVYVSGESQGVLARVRRSGTAGDRLATMITDSLIADHTVARMRGRAVLSDTGLQLVPALSLQVLPETGVIGVGKFVEFQDGGVTRRGIVRAMKLSAAMPKVRQKIEVETHA